MFMLTYGQLRDPKFIDAIQKISGCAMLKSPTIVYRVAKILEKAKKECDLSDKIHSEKIKPFWVKDEKNNLVIENREPKVQEDKKEEYDAILKEFNAVEVQFDLPKLVLDETLMVAQLTPWEVLALFPLLEIKEGGEIPQGKPELKSVT